MLYIGRMPDVLEGVLGFDPLVEWMKDGAVTQANLARACGVSQQTVSGWYNRRMRPRSDHVRIKLEVLSHGRVQRGMWLNAKEREPVIVVPLGGTGTEGE